MISTCYHLLKMNCQQFQTFSQITRDHYSALINLNFCFLLDYCTVNVKPDHSSETGRLKYGIEGFLASMCNESVNESIFK